MKAAFTFVIICSLACAEQAVLTDNRITTLAETGVSEAEIIRLVMSAPKIDFDLRPTATDAMMKSGVSENVIKAMAARESGSSPAPSVETAETAPGVAGDAPSRQLMPPTPARRTANHKKWDVPCQKVFVTGIQAHEIAWALQGEGLKNNLYKKTCMQPVEDASKADAILDIELDPKAVGMTQQRIRNRETAVANGDFWVSCRSDPRGSYCIDSTGYSLETSCNARGCSSYYGPNLGVTAVQLIGDALSAWAERSSAWAYMYSAKDHALIWKYEGLGTWHADLTKYSECPKSAATYGQTCKSPKKLLD